MMLLQAHPCFGGEQEDRVIVFWLLDMNLDSFSTTDTFLAFENLNHCHVVDAHIQRAKEVYLMLFSLDHEEVYISPFESVKVLRLIAEER